VNAVLTKHAKLRLQERTVLSEQDFVNIMDTYRSVSAGYEPQTFRWHRLFYSRADDTHYVAVQDISNGEVITILTLDYHDNLAWKISKKKLKQAVWRVDPRRHAELYRPRLSSAGAKFEITGVFWDSSLNTIKKNLGSFRFSTLPRSPDEAASDDSLMATILTRLQRREDLKPLSLDELLLYDKRTETLLKLPWDRITVFSLASDENTSNIA